VNMTICTGGTESAERVAELHAERIDEGFLASLGPRFLRRLYARIARSPSSFLAVAVEDARIIGFCAGTADVGELYRTFIIRDGVAAFIGSAPKLIGSTKRVIETLRYPRGAASLPPAEVLSVAVDEACIGRGVGGSLLARAQQEFRDRGVDTAKVVVGAENRAAIAMYRRAGFEPVTMIEMHSGTRSEVLVWHSPSS
jgi:ribosomal protein S18 acetylase RimI-like enzyme